MKVNKRTILITIIILLTAINYFVITPETKINQTQQQERPIDTKAVNTLLQLWQTKATERYSHETIKNTNFEYYQETEPSITTNSNDTNNLNKDNAWQHYQQLDAQGHTQAATAIITKQVVQEVSTQKRPEFNPNTIVPGQYTNMVLVEKNSQTTWVKTPKSKTNNQKVTLTTNYDKYNGWLYNKSHLIAWSLGGDMSDHNLIWGTRGQNVGSNYSKSPGGMSYIETLVRTYVKQNEQARVLYTVIPIYEPNETIPRVVYVEAIDLNNPHAFSKAIWTINQQTGVAINYQTGTAKLQQ